MRLTSTQPRARGPCFRTGLARDRAPQEWITTQASANEGVSAAEEHHGAPYPYVKMGLSFQQRIREHYSTKYHPSLEDLALETQDLL